MVLMYANFNFGYYANCDMITFLKLQKIFYLQLPNKCMRQSYTTSHACKCRFSVEKVLLQQNRMIAILFTCL